MSRALPLVRTKLADGTETRLGQARFVYDNAKGVSTLRLPDFGRYEVPFLVGEKKLGAILDSWLSARPLGSFTTSDDQVLAAHEALFRENLVELVAMVHTWSDERVEDPFDADQVLKAGASLFEKLVARAGSSPAEVARIAKARPKIGRPVLPSSRFEGLRIAVAFNIPLCRKTEARKPDEACYSIRLKPGGKVYGYVRMMRLRAVHYWVSQAGIERIRGRNREVCCYMLGDVTTSARTPSASWEEIRFNPFKHRCFVNAADECVRESDWAFFGQRRTFAAGVKRGEPHGPRRRPKSIRTRDNPTNKKRGQNDERQQTTRAE